MAVYGNNCVTANKEYTVDMYMQRCRKLANIQICGEWWKNLRLE